MDALDAPSPDSETTKTGPVRKKRPRVTCPCRNSKCVHSKGKAAVGAFKKFVLVDPAKKCIRLTAIESLTSPSILKEPHCEETRLRQSLIQTLHRLGLENSWYEYIPSYIGSAGFIDSAAKAIIAASCAQFPHSTAALALAAKHYTASIEGLRESVDYSDASLLAAAMLLLYETIQQQNLEHVYSHSRGIVAMVLGRRSIADMSDLACSVFYYTTIRIFRHLCVCGTPSPFDELPYAGLEPVYRCHTIPPETHQLRRIAHELYTRLPRLVTEVRTASEERENSTSINMHEDMYSLAAELEGLQDRNAESKALSRSAVHKTTWPGDPALSTHSLYFKNYLELRALLLYWVGRLMVSQLRTRVQDLQSGIDSHPCHSCGPPESIPLEVAVFAEEEEEVRLASNILMCYQQMAAFRFHIGSSAMRHGLIAVWRTVSHRPQYLGQSSHDIRHALLAAFHRSVTGWWTNLSCADLDKASDIFAGGPIDGFWTEPHPNGYDDLH